MKTTLILFMASFLAVCGHDPVRLYQYKDGTPRKLTRIPIMWKFACDFPPDVEDVVRRSFEYWQNVLGKPLFIEDKQCGISEFFILSKNRNGIVVVFDPHQEKIEIDGKKREIWGAAPMTYVNGNHMSGMVILYPNWLSVDDEGVQESVVRHEIGHILGFDHSTRRTCLMFETISKYDSKKGVCLPEAKKLRELYK